jgi:hypothetical protein
MSARLCESPGARAEGQPLLVDSGPLSPSRDRPAPRRLLLRAALITGSHSTSRQCFEPIRRATHSGRPLTVGQNCGIVSYVDIS